jgi:hypothetical protein
MKHIEMDEIMRRRR